MVVPSGARGLYEPSVSDSDVWWQYFDKRVWYLKALPVAGHSTHIVIVPGWRQHPELGRAVALMETFRHGLIYRVRALLGALRSAAGRRREP